MVGVVRDQLGRGENEHVEHRAIVISRGLEGSDVGLAHHAALTGNFCGELVQRLELRIGDGAAFADSGDRGVIDLRHAREVGVTRHAIGALVLVDDGEIDDVALLRREARFLGDSPQRAVGLERSRTLGEDAVQIGHKAPTLLDAVQDLDRGRRRVRGVVKCEAIDHFSSPS